MLGFSSTDSKESPHQYILRTINAENDRKALQQEALYEESDDDQQSEKSYQSNHSDTKDLERLSNISKKTISSSLYKENDEYQGKHRQQSTVNYVEEESIAESICDSIIKIAKYEYSAGTRQDEVLNKICDFIDSRLRPLIEENPQSIQKLEKGVRNFSRNLMKIGSRHGVGEDLSIKNKFIMLFENFMEWLGITSKYKDVEDIIRNADIADKIQMNIYDDAINNAIPNNTDSIAEIFAERINAKRQEGQISQNQFTRI